MADFNEQIQQNKKQVETLKQSIVDEKDIGKINEMSAKVADLNRVIAQQEKVFASAQDRVETWGKAYDGVKDKINKLSDASELMGKALGDSAKGFKPLVDNLKTAEQVTSKFRDAVAKANQAYTTYTEGVASGKSRFDALKDVFPALTKGVEGGTSGFKSFKIALAETGIGLIVIAVAALIEKLQTCKPVMDVVNAVMASIGAVTDTLMDNIGGLITNFGNLANFILHPIDSLKNLGKSMVSAAKDGYELSMAQEKLKTAMSAQEVVNDKINDQISLLKKQADDTKLSAKQRIDALEKEQRAEEQYYNQNSALAQKGLDNAAQAAGIKKHLNKAIVDDLKNRGAEAAAALLQEGKIDEEQFRAIKEAHDKVRELLKRQQTATEENQEGKRKIQEENAQKAKEAQEEAKRKRAEQKKEREEFIAEAEEVRTQSIARMAEATMDAYNLEISRAQDHYKQMLKNYEKFIGEYAKMNKADQKLHQAEYKKAQEVVAQIKTEETNSLAAITKKFQDDDLAKLTAYETELQKIAANADKSAIQLALQEVDEKYKTQLADIDDILKKSETRSRELQNKDDVTPEEIQKEKVIQDKAKADKAAIEARKKAEKTKLTDDDQLKKEQDIVTGAEQNGEHIRALKLQRDYLDAHYKAAKAAAEKEGKGTADIQAKYDKQKQDLEDKLLSAKIHAGDKYIDAVLKNTRKDSAIYKAAFLAKKATSIADVIISTKKAVIDSLKAYSSIPFVGQALGIAQAAFMAGQGAMSIAEIAKQKPGFAQGGRFVSDGRGALLSGYSRTDDTNAFLRSGEAVIVSEAMRNPWARNLVSAINVAHGGRDFSTTGNSRGYAVGGIFTDGGNANRYYSQPVHDAKDLANTLAYQMINNFPPIYVDVKDVNNQQNILAQTVNRVNL